MSAADDFQGVYNAARHGVADAWDALAEIDRLRIRENKLNRIEQAFEGEKAAKSAYEAHPSQEMFARWGIARQALTNALEGKT